MDKSLTDAEKLWDISLKLIKNNEKINEGSFSSWFLPLKAIKLINDTIYLATTQEFTKDWINSNFSDLITRNLATATNSIVNKFIIVVMNADGSYPLDNIEKKTINNSKIKVDIKERKSTYIPNYHFNPRYTFDNFVIGNSNRFAHAAALAVAEQPSEAYNPLFLFGGVGLGKTHLMHAIAQLIIKNNPNCRVAYLSTEKFTNEWIDSIRDNKTEAFRNKYRNIDVLLIDDIQFLANKDRTQEEFFHTFNALHEQRSQIVISSDRPPQEIPTLESRLSSRFLWGLTTDMQSPDLETRIAILKKKCDLDNIHIPSDDILFYIANQIDSNIRELEGALNRLLAFSKLHNKPISIELCIESLKNIVPENKIKIITPEVIQQSTAQYFKLKVDDMKAKKRTSNISFPRQIAMYLCRELTENTFEKIGEDFGNRHYSTVIHAHEEINQKMKTDPKLANFIEDIKKQIEKM